MGRTYFDPVRRELVFDPHAAASAAADALVARSLVPISGHTTPPDSDKISDGVANAQMSRIWIPTVLGCRVFAPVWTGTMVASGTDSDAGVARFDAPVPNTVYSSAAVETVDGLLYRLRVAGSTRWAVAPGQRMEADPVMIDVLDWLDGFWLRVFVVCDPGGVWVGGRYVATGASPAGQLTVKYSIDRHADFASRCAALGATLLWSLDSATQASDLSGHGHDGEGKNGVAFGTARGAFGGATQLDGVKQAVMALDYNPFVNGQPVSVAGLGYKDDDTSDGTVFSGGGEHALDDSTPVPGMRVKSGASPSAVDFRAQAGGTTVTWNGVWPKQTPVFYTLVFDEPNDTVELWINGVSQGVKALAQAFASPLLTTFEVGCLVTPNFPWKGWMQWPVVFENKKLTDAEAVALYNDYLSSSADQTAGTGALSTANSLSSGSDDAYAPVALLGTPQ